MQSLQHTAPTTSMSSSPSRSKANYNFKVVLLGEGRVGKTSILLRYVQNKYADGTESTLQASYLDKRVTVPRGGGGRGGARSKSGGSVLTANLSIWDTAGQERFHSLGPIYYRDAEGAILVYDITDGDSFKRVQRWVKELRKMVGEDIVLVIVGNKIDLKRSRVVQEDEVLEYARSVGALHYYTSAKLDVGLREVFDCLTLKMGEAAARSGGRGGQHGGGGHGNGGVNVVGDGLSGVGGAARQKLIVLSEEEAPPPKQSSCC